MAPKVKLASLARVFEGSSGTFKINGKALRMNADPPSELVALIKKHPELNADVTYQIGDTINIGGVIKNGQEVVAEMSTTLHGAVQEKSLLQDLLEMFCGKQTARRIPKKKLAKLETHKSKFIDEAIKTDSGLAKTLKEIKSKSNIDNMIK